MAKERDTTSLLAYLNDHVRYERWMLGEAFRAIHITPEGPVWNMAFESFCVHARNLYDFLRHEGKKANTFRADDYVPGRKKPDAELHFNDFDTLLFHMAAARTDRAKLSLKRLQKLGAWLDREWLVWANSLGQEFAGSVDKQKACVPLVLQNGVSNASACTHSVSSSFIINHELSAADGGEKVAPRDRS